MEQKRIIDTLLGVLAYHHLVSGSRSEEMTLFHPKVLATIRRLVEEPEFRIPTLDIYDQCFGAGGSDGNEWFEALKDLFGEHPIWAQILRDMKELASASGTGDTPPTSKS